MSAVYFVVQEVKYFSDFVGDIMEIAFIFSKPFEIRE
jgi:hypothetical protein